MDCPLLFNLAKLKCLNLKCEFHNFQDLHMHDVMSPVQQASLEYGKAYILQIEILHYINFVRKKEDVNTCVSSGFTLLYSGITSHPHSSDQHVVHYITIIKHIFGKFNSFLQIDVIWKNRLRVSNRIQRNYN